MPLKHFFQTKYFIMNQYLLAGLFLVKSWRTLTKGHQNTLMTYGDAGSCPVIFLGTGCLSAWSHASMDYSAQDQASPVLRALSQLQASL